MLFSGSHTWRLRAVLTNTGTQVFAFKVATYALGAVTSICVTRWLDPHDRGQWSVAVLLVTLVALASEWGLGIAGLNAIRAASERTREVVSTVLIIGVSLWVLTVLVVGGAFFSGAPAVQTLFGLPSRLFLLGLITGGLVLITLLARTFLLGLGDVVGFNVSTGGQAAASLVLISTVAFAFRPGASVFVGGYAVALGITCVATLVRLHRRSPLTRSISLGSAPGLMRYGFTAHVATLALFLAYRFDLLIVNRYLGLSAAGLYSITLTLSEMLRGIPESAQAFIISRSREPDFRRNAQRSAVASAGLTLIVGGALALLGAPLVAAIFGSPYAPAGEAFKWLLPGMVALAISYSVSPLLSLSGRAWVSAVAGIAAFVVMVAADIILVPRYALAGAAAGSSLAYVVLVSVQLGYLVHAGDLSTGGMITALREEEVVGARGGTPT